LHRVQDLRHDADLLTRVASLYYLEDITQAEIAATLGLSRPKVGRLLKRARDERVVEITVHAHPALNMRLEATLKERFGLQQVFLAADQRDAPTQRALVAQLVAGYLARTVQDNMVVAVGMGRNVGAVPDHLARSAARACTFVPALGGSPLVGQPINPDDVCRRLAERFGSKSESLYAPAYAENEAVRDSFMSHETVRRTIDCARHADIALVGIGDARDDSMVVRIGCFSFQEMRRLRQAGAVGDMLGFFFDIHGIQAVHNMGNRVVGLGADDLRRIPCVIAIACEADKTAAILGALRTGIVDMLATSTGNARNILALDAEARV
jgi:DNA-binding transcriptional regulator LsrR (DeoR family)